MRSTHPEAIVAPVQIDNLIVWLQPLHAVRDEFHVWPCQDGDFVVGRFDSEKRGGWIQ
jgi:hypothetical protein